MKCKIRKVLFRGISKENLSAKYIGGNGCVAYSYKMCLCYNLVIKSCETSLEVVRNQVSWELAKQFSNVK